MEKWQKFPEIKKNKKNLMSYNNLQNILSVTLFVFDITSGFPGIKNGQLGMYLKLTESMFYCKIQIGDVTGLKKLKCYQV